MASEIMPKRRQVAMVAMISERRSESSEPVPKVSHPLNPTMPEKNNLSPKIQTAGSKWAPTWLEKQNKGMEWKEMALRVVYYFKI